MVHNKWKNTKKPVDEHSGYARNTDSCLTYVHATRNCMCSRGLSYKPFANDAQEIITALTAQRR